MSPYFLALTFPSAIRQQLASLCYGLPQIHWVEEENFHLTLRYFGSLNDVKLTDLDHALTQIFFTPFQLTLKGIGYFYSKRNRGVLWAGLAENDPLIDLKKTIDNCVRPLDLPKDERLFHPHVTLGRYEKLSSDKLGDYLFQGESYQSPSFEVTGCTLLRTQQTPKRIFYEEVAYYPASLLEKGDD